MFAYLNKMVVMLGLGIGLMNPVFAEETAANNAPNLPS